MDFKYCGAVTLPKCDKVLSLEFTKRGLAAICRHERDVFAYNVDLGVRTNIATVHSPSSNTRVFAAQSLDGRLVALLTSYHWLVVMDMNEEDTNKKVLFHKKSAHRSDFRVAFSPDSRYVVLLGPDDGLRVFNVDDGSEMWRVPCIRLLVFFDFASEEGTLIFSRGNKTISVYDMRTGKLLRRRDNVGVMLDTVVSPNGRHAISIDIDVRCIDLSPAMHDQRKMNVSVMNPSTVSRHNRVLFIWKDGLVVMDVRDIDASITFVPMGPMPLDVQVIVMCRMAHDTSRIACLTNNDLVDDEDKVVHTWTVTLEQQMAMLALVHSELGDRALTPVRRFCYHDGDGAIRTRVLLFLL